ncbi:MAG TPA: D-2-hydroxyacid dehydrogenase, partial [Trebonia sp.]|nr:D-2-hydroxyacid dehydrogenase [Trebonia sp.]
MTDVTIAIGSFLETEHVQRIAAAGPGLRVLYEPELLPVPRFPCDHTGLARSLRPAELDRWHALRAEADVFFDFDWLDPASMAPPGGRLRWIQATSAGIGALMRRTGLDRRAGGGGTGAGGPPLTVTSAAGIHAQPLAEFAVLGALYVVKGVPRLREWQRERHWELYATRQLAGQRALVVGLGGIGRRVVASFAALGVEVWGLGRAGAAYDVDGLTRLVDRAGLDAALPVTDILVLACPLTAETAGLIGARQLDLLPRGAALVNVARGPVVDQAALTAALRSGHLGGACLDVFATEPLPPGDPLWDMENVIISPHSASTVATENAALTDLFIDNLGRFLRGAPLRNRYDPARGYLPGHRPVAVDEPAGAAVGTLGGERDDRVGARGHGLRAAVTALATDASSVTSIGTNRVPS